MNHVHGGSRRGKILPEYYSWADMKSRCENPKHHAYKNYGGRGIKICQQWRLSFATFIEDMGRRPSPKYSLDRFPDNNGNYEPGNCRWATTEQQLRNQRSNHLLEYDGKLMSIAGWSELLHIPRSVIDSRLERGWSIELVLTKPMRKYPRQVSDGKPEEF
jgi:hypothetical protein